LERKYRVSTPCYRVTFSDGSTHTMRFLDLFMYALDREASLFCTGKADTLSYIDYNLISGDERQITPIVAHGIESMKGR